ncbi:uncharacterized protein [Battus philenor]|uniref:uncharacterized protein n=1 Tax=Battus philenor TaxID=42288 RepID=UPI0035D0707F
MSEQEKKNSSTGAGGSSILVVDHQTSGNRQKQSYRPTELQEEPPEIHHKRSRAPAVPSVTEELKDICADSDVSTDTEVKEQQELERAENYDKQKQLLAKNLSSNNKKYDTPEHTEYETITLAPMQIEPKLDTVVPQHPIPPAIEKESIASHVPEKSTVKKVDEDSIKDEVAELRTPEAAKKPSDWSDEEEAGGLPRVETRASRVSRKVRTLFCCGVPYEAPSEDDVSTDYWMSGI